MCITCPAGYACLSTSQPPLACETGTYNTIEGRYINVSYNHVVGSTACFQCPSGHYCASNDTDPVECPAGTYSNGGAVSACTTCSPGSYSPVTGASTCVDCPIGHNCTSTSATPCPRGMYKSDHGMLPTIVLFDYSLVMYCTNCPSGYWSNTGESSCNTCPQGKYCYPASAEPQTCSQGFYSPGGAITQCLACDAGMLRIRI